MKRRQGISLDEMGKHGKELISTGRQNCAENGPEWVESDEIDSEDLMDVSQGRNEETHLEKWEQGNYDYF